MQQLRQMDVAPGAGLVMPKGMYSPTPRVARAKLARLVDPERGLGDFNQEVSLGAQAGGSLVSVLTATGAIGGPVGAAIGAGIGLAATLIKSLFQPNWDKIAASNDANQAEGILKNNLANWLSIPVSQRTASVQSAALAVFDATWAKYQQLVQPLLKKAPNSISDRQSGSCAYHTSSPAGWDASGNYTPNLPNQSSGACWNWFIGYRDPIAKDPNVIPDSVDSLSSSVASTLGQSGLLLAGLGLVLLGVIL